ncbi:RDD family protein [uncultured Halopseudomonas sp.]|uniref:RDD family protein n=1 Tax=uncultured Halopseudomonas sp. TaxID=2901193 RepID=UPI0030ED9E7A
MEKSLPAPRHARRFSAYLLDILICLLVARLIPYAAGLIMGSHAFVLSSYAHWVALAYFLLKDSLPNGQSIGKRILGIAVIGTVTYQNCKWWQSALRNLVLMVLLPVEILFVLLNNRRLGDALVSTMVIETKGEIMK